MKTKLKQAIGYASLATVLISWVGCTCVQPVQISADGRLVILQEPQSQLVMTNTTATFSVAAMHVGPPATNTLSYQWRFNGVTIAGATNSTYSIASAQFSNVGAYDVVVTGSSLTSQKALLSLYSLTPSGGTLQVPIGVFGTESPSFTCGAENFDKGFYPTNNDGTPALFYGPSAPSQIGPFVNTVTGSTSLIIDTFSSDNGNADTAIRIKKALGAPSPICNDDFLPQVNPPQTYSKQSKCTWSPLSSTATLKASIFYKSAPTAPSTPPPNGIVTFHWKYQ